MNAALFTDKQLAEMTSQEAENIIPFLHVSECGCITYNLWLHGKHYAKACPKRDQFLIG